MIREMIRVFPTQSLRAAPQRLILRIDAAKEARWRRRLRRRHGFVEARSLDGTVPVKWVAHQTTWTSEEIDLSARPTVRQRLRWAWSDAVRWADNEGDEA